MKATIEFDDQLYRRLKIEAARRGRTVRDLVADGVRQVLATPTAPAAETEAAASADSWRPSWFGVLEPKARTVDDHSLDAVRASVARGRAAVERPTKVAPAPAPRPPRAKPRAR